MGCVVVPNLGYLWKMSCLVYIQIEYQTYEL